MRKIFTFAIICLLLSVPFFVFAEEDVIDTGLATQSAKVESAPAQDSLDAAPIEPTAQPQSEATAVETAQPEAVQEVQATAQETPVPEAIPAATQEVTLMPAEDNDTEGIIILSPGESEEEQLQKFITPKRRKIIEQQLSGEGVAQAQEEEALADEEDATEKPDAAFDEETEGELILVQDEKKARVERTGYVLVEKAGFIAQNFVEDGSVFNNEGKTFLAQNDFGFIKVAVGKGAKKGTEFIIYDDSEDITDQFSGEYLGKLIDITGVAKVVEKLKDNVYKIKILRTYAITKNNSKIKFRKDVKDYYTKFVTKKKPKLSVQTKGAIIKIRENTIVATKKSVVYMNRGLEEGLYPGDTVDVIRPDADGEEYESVGKITVINSLKRSSVGIVKDQKSLIRVGDTVQRIKE